VANGHQPGIYTDWPSAQKQIAGWHKAKHKSFSTYSEAEAYLRQAQASTRADDAPAPKRPKASERTPPASTLPAPGTEPLAADAEDGFDSSLVLDAGSGATRRKTSSEGAATRAEARVDAARDELAVWTDGACRANGRAGARAGVGVWFGPDDPRCVFLLLRAAFGGRRRAVVLTGAMQERGGGAARRPPDQPARRADGAEARARHHAVASGCARLQRLGVRDQVRYGVVCGLAAV